MEVQLETQQVRFPRNSRSRLVQRVKRALSFSVGHIQRLSIRIKDVNGDKRGEDKVCTLQAKLVGGGEVVVVQKSHSVARSLFRGLRRLKSLVTRKVRQRRRSHLKGRVAVLAS
jgi:hypothetical protein